MNRRRLLQSLTAGLTIAVAGCGGSDDATPTDTGPDTDTTQLSPTPEPTDTPATPAETQSATATETPSPETPTATPEPTPEPTPTPSPAAQTVEIGAGGGLSFAPDSFTISAGDTVEWGWVGANHNVTPNSIPTEAEWSGTPGAPDDTFDEGYTYRYTFDVPGEYTYYCNPHRGAGMTGSFTVTE
ncbi:plastocyanin/azurin family copper-binding protein [Salinibaculum salinum]|uniref:plastocyanin/azurin family copper-binding protein n=1 Tax=Salinibaculum salinum TaxID=3131996 RepID=UPI0030ECEF24